MAWNDEIFRNYIEAAARAVGKDRTTVLREGGLSPSALSSEALSGRRIDMIEKLMGPLNWTPADALRCITVSFEWPLNLLDSAIAADRRRQKLRESMARIAEAATRLHLVLGEYISEDAEFDEALTLSGARCSRGKRRKKKSVSTRHGPGTRA